MTASRTSAVIRSAKGLHLAAAPTFAAMALLTALMGEASSLCGTASSPGGMASMYLLMSAFHLPAWIWLIAGRSGAWLCGAPRLDAAAASDD